MSNRLQEIELQQNTAQTGAQITSQAFHNERNIRPILSGQTCFDRCCCSCCSTPLWKEIRAPVLAVSLLSLLALLLILAGIIILVGVKDAAFAGGVVLAAGILFLIACSYPVFSIYRKWKEAQSFEVLDDEGDSHAKEEAEYDA